MRGPRIDQALRGCMGSSLAIRPLIADVAHSAHAAAFLDPRFPAFEAEELPEVRIHISVLSSLQRLECNSEAELLETVGRGAEAAAHHARAHELQKEATDEHR